MIEKENRSRIIIRIMTIEDYENVFALWEHISGFGIRCIDDSKEGIERFLKRNPTTSVVAEEDGKMIGSILCGHDGRTGYFYHVCVDESYRHRKIATHLAEAAIRALQKEYINKVSLITFAKNKMGNAFWQELGWNEREDVNYYELILNCENVVHFISETEK